MQFDVKYFLVAILFIIFDLEIAFLFPWAASLHLIGDIGFYSMIFFLFLLVMDSFMNGKKGYELESKENIVNDFKSLSTEGL